MVFKNIRAYTLCMLIVLSIISRARPVSAEMKGIPRTEENNICAVVETDKKVSKEKEAVRLIGPSLPVITETTTPAVPTTAEKPASLSSDILFEMINSHRATLGLPAYQKEDKLCTLAKERGPELYDEIFTSGNIHGGLYNRNLPYWITENMKYGPDENDVFNWWMNSYIHKKAIEGNFTYSCGECYGNSCAQLFTSYVAK